MFKTNKLAILLAVLLALNALRYLSGRKSSPAGDPSRSRMTFDPRQADGGPSEGDSTMRQRMEIALQKVPEGQRREIEKRVEKDRAFFETLRELPEAQRRAEMDAHFAQNPLPADFIPPTFGDVDPPGAPPAGGTPNGAPPGDGGAIHLPPPAVRKSMDRQIANSQKKDK